MPSQEDIALKITKLKNLPQYSGKNQDELSSLATDMLIQQEQEADVTGIFSDKKEKKLAKELLRKYIEDYTIETVSDRNTLKDIIYLEMVNLRIQNKLNELSDKDNAVPTAMVEVIHSNIEALTKLKTTLGIVHKANDKRDGYDELDKLKKKFKIWRENNQGTRTMVCPHCGKMVMLKIRTEAWEAQRHPFFKDRVLANKHLILLYRTNKITKEDVAKVLEVSPDYVDWLVDKWGKELHTGE
jgi:hypothetical protein